MGFVCSHLLRSRLIYIRQRIVASENHVGTELAPSKTKCDRSDVLHVQ